jgi:spartin
MVDNASEEYLRICQHPAYQKSTIVQTSATASRLIVTGSTKLASILASQADSYQRKTQPNPTPMTFSPATHARIRKINAFTAEAVGLSAKTIGSVSRYAQNIGAAMARRGEKGRAGFDKDGRPLPNYKPGVLNKSMMAFSTVMDGIDQAGRNLLQSGSTAASTVVGHKYGNEARTVASNLVGGVKNVGLVYIDVMGVSRRAVIKSVAKGMVVGRMPNGQQLVVGTGDGGVVPAEVYPEMKQNNGMLNDYAGGMKPGLSTPGYGAENYGNASIGPPAYSSQVGEPFGSTLQGQNVREKR